MVKTSSVSHYDMVSQWVSGRGWESLLFHPARVVWAPSQFLLANSQIGLQQPSFQCQYSSRSLIPWGETESETEISSLIRVEASLPVLISLTLFHVQCYAILKSGIKLAACIKHASTPSKHSITQKKNTAFSKNTTTLISISRMGLLIQAKNDWLPFFVCFPLLYCQFKPSNAAIVVWFLLSFPGSKSVLFSPNNNVQIGWFIIWFWWNEVEIWALWGGTRCCWNAFWIELAEKRMHFKSTECQNGFYHANKCHFTIKLFQNTAHSWRLRTST